MYFSILLCISILVIGSVTANDCDTLGRIFTEYGIEKYWENGTHGCCDNYKDYEYPIIINCNQDRNIVKIHMTDLYLDNKPISENFCYLNSLISLELINDGLTGNIPNCLTSITSLEYLNLSENNLSGNLLRRIDKLRKLKELNLSKNNLSGALPEGVGNIASLENLYLDSNKFSGVLPNSLDNLSSIKIIDFSNNKFYGELPEEIYCLSTLEHLYLNNNGFSGQITEDLGGLTVITELDLTNNQFEGAIPETIGYLQNLEWLSLAGNKFNSDFPKNLRKLKYLSHLDISDNDFRSLPPTLKDLHYLYYIDISDNNNFTGRIDLGTSVEECHMNTNNVCVNGGSCKNGIRYCNGETDTRTNTNTVNNNSNNNNNNNNNNDNNDNTNDNRNKKINKGEAKCWVAVYGYSCCEGKALQRVYATDDDGKWGYDFKKQEWCGISTYKEISDKFNEIKNKNKDECWSLEYGYGCCLGCTSFLTTDEGKWGIEHSNWCGIPSYCKA